MVKNRIIEMDAGELGRHPRAELCLDLVVVGKEMVGEIGKWAALA